MAGKEEGVKETPQQKAMVEKAMAQHADYKARWLPLQKQMAGQNMDLAKADSSERARSTGRAAVETQAKFCARHRQRVFPTTSTPLTLDRWTASCTCTALVAVEP